MREGQLRAFMVKSGTVLLSDEDFTKVDVTENEAKLTNGLLALTKGEIASACHNMGFQFRGEREVSKSFLVKLFVDHWDEMRENSEVLLAIRTAPPLATTSASASSGEQGARATPLTPATASSLTTPRSGRMQRRMRCRCLKRHAPRASLWTATSTGS